MTLLVPSFNNMVLLLITGWVKFKLNNIVTSANRLPSSSASSESSGDWTTAFYVTRVDKIRAILDCGQPLPIGKESKSKYCI